MTIRFVSKFDFDGIVLKWTVAWLYFLAFQNFFFRSPPTTKSLNQFGDEKKNNQFVWIAFFAQSIFCCFFNCIFYGSGTFFI